MTRSRKITAAAAMSLAAQAAFLAAPAPAWAQDCHEVQMQCYMEFGDSTKCIHDYLACVAGGILRN
jgi:hypothetical protein